MFETTKKAITEFVTYVKKNWIKCIILLVCAIVVVISACILILESKVAFVVLAVAIIVFFATDKLFKDKP